MTITVTENERKNGVEIRFDKTPDKKTTGHIQLHGFLRSRRDPLMWYARRTPATRQIAQQLARPTSSPIPANPLRPRRTIEL